MKENSIEEDIKDIKKYISFTSKRENFSHDTDWNWNKDLANKIEHVLSDYERALKENEELNYKLHSKKIALEIYNRYIPKSKIKAKIEQLKMNANYDWMYKYDYQDVVKMLQELLEEGEE